MKRILTLSGSFLLIHIVASLITILVVGIMVAVSGDINAINSGFSLFFIYCLSFIIEIVGLKLFRQSLQIEMPNISSLFKGLNIPMVVVAFIVVTALGVVFDPLFKLLPEIGMDNLYNTMSKGVMAFITLAIAAPILEEYVFRGVMQRTLTKASSPWVGILISALIFGVIHGIPQQAANAMVVGVLLGIVYYLTNSLLTVIVLHAINNGLAYFVTEEFGAQDPMEIWFPTSTSQIILYVMSAIIVLAFAKYAIGAVRKKYTSQSAVSNIDVLSSNQKLNTSNDSDQ